MRKLDLRQRLKESLTKPPSQANFSEPPPSSTASEARAEATKPRNKTVNTERAKPICITLFPSELQLLDQYRKKRAGEGYLLNVSEAIREMMKKETL